MSGIESLESRCLLTGLPDLLVNDITAPSQAASGDVVLVSWKVTNQGSGDFRGRFRDELYLSEDQSFGSDESIGTFDALTFIPAGQSITRQQAIQMPISAEGTGYFIVQTDVLEQIIEESESGESNNITIDDASIQIDAAPTSNLQVSAVTTASNAFSGQTVLVNWTTSNVGSAATNASHWRDALYLSDDQVLDASDVLLGTADNASWLAAGESYTNSLSVTLPEGIESKYYVVVVTDSSNDIFERNNEDDNSAVSGPIAVQLTPPADLQVTRVEAPLVALAGETVSLQWTTANLGSGSTSASSWQDRVYLSSNQQIDSSDWTLVTREHSGTLTPDGSYTATASVTLPEGISGDYYFLVRADELSQVYEHGEDGNNDGSSNPATMISLPASADLTVPYFHGPASGAAGSSILVEWSVENVGPGRTGVSIWRDQVIISSDDVLSDDDYVLLSREHNNVLEPGDAYTVSQSVDLPIEIAAGEYYLFATTDAEDVVFEGDDTASNTSIAKPISISRITADLEVSYISVTAPTIFSGESFEVIWTVENTGMAATNADSWFDEVYLSVDQVLSGDDVYLGRRQHVGVLGQGGSYTVNGAFTVPVDMAGEFYVVVRTDSYEEVFEGEWENNNDRSTAGAIDVTLSPVADLVISSLSGPSSAVGGQDISVTWTVENRGTNATGDWIDALYLSLDQVFDPSNDVLLGSSQHQGGLGSQVSYTQMASYTIPEGLEGSWWLLAYVDAGDDVYERAAELNNIGFSSTKIVIDSLLPADLVPTVIAVPTLGMPGQTATISYTVENQGDSTALGAWTDSLYLSADAVWDVADPLIARATHAGDVLPGASYTASISAELPGVVAGDYHVIVRSDIYNRVPESNEENNQRVSLDSISISPTVVQSGATLLGQFDSSGFAYYRIQVEPGFILSVDLENTNSDAWNQLFVSYEQLPTPSEYEAGSIEPFLQQRVVRIPLTLAGTYYITVYAGVQVTDNLFTLSAALDAGTPPVAEAGPDQAVLLGEPVTFDGSGSFDADGEPLSYLWDFGDGQIADGELVTHTFANPGVYTVTLTVDDAHVGGIARDQLTVVVSGSKVIEGTLKIVGTTANDRVVVYPMFQQIVVWADFLPSRLHTRWFAANEVVRIDVRLLDGDDYASLAFNVHRPALMDGGSGDDLLHGSWSDDILLGGPGNDLLFGSLGRDLLIGGLGADRIFGSEGQDILVAGITLWDNNDLALQSIMEEWTAQRNFSTRINNLRGIPKGSHDRMNGDYFLSADGSGLAGSPTVFDDSDRDIISGGSSRDWFLAKTMENGSGVVFDLLLDLRRRDRKDEIR
ncbi:MAG: PKD domain-containing protein [bacterium]|nr:PKD domain-containing protein [bacterium]